MPILDERHDFAHPVEPDTAWSESYYFNAYDPVTDAGLFTRIGVRPHEGTMDVGLSVWLPGSELATVHGVRPQREMTDSDLAVAGVRYERLRPMAEWRITCDAEASVRDLAGRRPPRTTRVALDLVFHALAPAVGSDGQGRAGAGASAATRASVGKGHLEQAGRWNGWIEADGKRHALGDARGNRDKSLGPRRWGGPRMWRWFSINVGDDAHFGGIRIGTEAGDLHRGWVWRDGEATSVRQWDVRTEPEMRETTSGLQCPEGPVALADGSVVVVEIKRGTLTRVAPDGKQTIVATTGGGPNGAAIGPDGLVYVCNNGGFEWHDVGGLLVPGNQAPDYSGGRIQRVDLATGKVEDLYGACDGRALRGPNDIVFDASGGFWFTDHGKMRERDRDRTGVFYARADGSRIREVLFPLDAPNGIGLSPDGRRLYVAETWTGRVWSWELAGPGEVVAGPGFGPAGGTLLAGLPGFQLFDSLAVDGAGDVCVATLVTGAITVISPAGEVIEQVPTGDPLTTNICFGGRELRTAYVTASGTGRLLATEWPRPGLRLEYQ